MMARGLAPLLAAFALAACANKPPAPPPQPSLSTPPAPATTFDGSYQGTRTLTAAKAPHARCGSETNTAAIHVHNSVAILRLVPDHHPIAFHARIAPGGVLRSTFKGNTVDGTFNAQSFDGTVETRFCVFSVHADRV